MGTVSGMTDILVTATFRPVSNLTEDYVTNTFAFHSDASIDLTGVFDALVRFYDEPVGAGQALVQYMAPSINKEAADGLHLRAYGITGKLMGAKKGQPATYAGSPIAERSHNLLYGALSNNALPPEVAVVMTTRAEDWMDQPVEAADGNDVDPGVDRIRQRYTGRIYFGPLNDSARTTDANGNARVSAGLTTTMLGAADRMQAEAATALGVWSVWSRADEALRPVDEVQVDNDFDTQRRRGVRSTGRTSVTL